MADKNIIYPFKNGALADFVYAKDLLPFTDKDIVNFDQRLSEYEHVFLNPDIERHLLTKNEMLASFAISKAEQSSLTLQEAGEIYDYLIKNPEYDFIGQKLKAKKKLTRKDYEKLEFYNITKTFRALNQKPFSLKKFSYRTISEIHRQLTVGLDIFSKYLPAFDCYRSGSWRNNNRIRVAEYEPPDYKSIIPAIKELILWLRKHPSINNIAIFHTALYAIHPFNNGNKRVCRILEHIFLRQIGLNRKNLFSSTYYYHQEKNRYYKYLLHSLTHKNFNHFVAFAQEAIVLSIISVIKTGLEVKKYNYLEKQNIALKIKKILKPLLKRRELNFKNLYKYSNNQIARQTFVSYLQEAQNLKIINRRQEGRAVYYSLAIKTKEEEKLVSLIGFVQSRLNYIPDEIKLIIV